jgi:hypothetical protein
MLFLTPNPSWQNQQSIGRFKNTPVGRNQISSWMAESAKNWYRFKKKKKITNHSVRATAVSNLAKQGVGEQQLIKITGHSSAHSIRPYLQMDMEHHQTIINSMRQKIKPFAVLIMKLHHYPIILPKICSVLTVTLLININFVI